MKLGKLAPKAHPKTLDLARYVLEDAPPPPKVYWEYKIDPSAIGMYGNDTIGDCTCAAVAHYIMLATAHTGKLVTPDPADIIAVYSAISGYDPTTGANDNGAAITDVLAYWQTTGIAGHRILAWAQIDHSNLDSRHRGIWWFGANDVGVQLPAKAESQFAAGEPWDTSWFGNNIVGGHCIIETGYGSEGSNFQTWGKGDQKASNAWTKRFVDEAYVVITQDWLNEASGLAPNSLDLDALRADLDKLKQ